MTCGTLYETWLAEVRDDDLLSELKQMNGSGIEDAFYRELSFGTGGLRGILGAGTNRMNIYTVAQATQGLADYLNGHDASPSAVIGFDTRINSRLFADTAAEVLSANGIRVHRWQEPLPVPTVSYAVRFLKASAGIMITASHNPAQYNGYKVYGADGCQITSAAADAIQAAISRVDIFRGVRHEPRAEILPISGDVLTSYIEQVKAASLLFGETADKNVSIVYSPLNGTGLVPVTRVLAEEGYGNITVVEEQKLPDGHFPTCPYPNPEIREALALGLEYCSKYNADLLLATDPDCDRVGTAVKDRDGTYRLLSGNEVCLLLLDYVCTQRKKHGRMPERPVMIKTIVTSELSEQIAEHYGVETVNVLTGFKYIGEQIGLLEREGEADRFIFGFEESYGYLSGAYVRDKDGVNGACLIAEMFGYYRARGITLLEKLDALYASFGFARNALLNRTFEGAAGFRKMQSVMKRLREAPLTELAGVKVAVCTDYLQGIGTLPKADALKYRLEDGTSVVIRPSGTEPKLKVYISTRCGSRKAAEMRCEACAAAIERFLA